MLGSMVFPASMVATAMAGKAINSTGWSYAQASLVERPGKILFISGHFDAATQGLPEQARFLAKPFTREALLAAIAGALEGN